MRLKAPFPWFGGKSTVARSVWLRLGDVSNYIEPFSGSAAMSMRIALAGYDGEHNELEAIGWQSFAWKSNGGYGSAPRSRQ